jgi:prevent-host-death family protein
VTDAATRAPVAITQHCKPRYVLMSAEDFEKLAVRARDPRRVFGPGETPDDVASMFLPALDQLIEDGNREP